MYFWQRTAVAQDFGWGSLMWHLKECFAFKRVSIWRDNPNTLIRLEPVLSYWKEWRNNETPPSNLKRVFNGAKQELGHLPTPNV